MLERFLGNPWVTAVAFIVGPAILVWIYWRRRRIARPPARAGASAKRADEVPKAAAAPAPEQAAGPKALWPGYRDARWGQPPTTAMRLLHDEGDTRFYARSSDDLVIGTVQLSSVVYSYRLDRLEAVVIELSAGGFELLTRYLTAEWGPPRTSADRTKHVWTDPGNGPEESQAILEKRVESRTARLVLSSRAALAGREKG